MYHFKWLFFTERENKTFRKYTPKKYKEIKEVINEESNFIG